MNTANALRKVSAAADVLAPLIPSPYRGIAIIVGEAVALAADFAAAGEDPIGSITRIRNHEPLLQAMRATWRERLRRRFGEVTALGKAPDSLDDVYDDLDNEARRG